MLHQYQQAKMLQNINQINLLNNIIYPNQQIPYPFLTGYNFMPKYGGIERKRTNPKEIKHYQKRERLLGFQSEIPQKQTKNSFNKNESAQKINYPYYNAIQTYEEKIEEFEHFIHSRKPNIVDYLCTQRGTKDIEKFLKKSSFNECITILLNSLNVNLTNVMIDIYGNYFCQKLIKSATPNQIVLILKFISKDFVLIAKDYSGTHVLQAIIDAITTEEQENIILTSVKDSVLEMGYDSNATHVLQKIIQCIDESKRENINKVILENIKPLSLDSNGICLLKKYIASNNIEENKRIILHSLTENCLEISQNPFGNYVIQFIFDEWEQKECESVIKILIENICLLSKQKFSSNVVEKIIEISEKKQKDEIFKAFCNEEKIMEIIKNKFGKYVLQKSISYMTKEQKDIFRNFLNKLIDATGRKDKKFISSFIEYLRV